ncbi:MAG: hypothetical protein H6Q16_525 [Bacteroidetes bacterium]|nr:hypothetical protein [Bacteroidota bacterium]
MLFNEMLEILLQKESSQFFFTDKLGDKIINNIVMKFKKEYSNILLGKSECKFLRIIMIL